MMHVLQGDNVAKCSFTVMNANIAWLVKKTNENFGRLMQVLWDENIVGCNMKLSQGRYYMPKKLLCLLLMFHVICLTNTTKFEFVKKQYLNELMKFLK
jgi:hypothetical protein